MKGVSSVIAIILILMIVVALAALAYTWFTGIFASLTSTTSTAVTTTTTAMGTSFRIEFARNTSTTGFYAYIRNVGSESFNASSSITGIYVDGQLASSISLQSCSPTCTNSILTAGASATYTATSPVAFTCEKCPGACSNIVKVTVATGLADSTNVVC